MSNDLEYAMHGILVKTGLNSVYRDIFCALKKVSSQKTSFCSSFYLRLNESLVPQKLVIFLIFVLKIESPFSSRKTRFRPN
jgi:hypothetical protein